MSRFKKSQKLSFLDIFVMVKIFLEVEILLGE
jgi:hypothetical protein